ncbi:Glycoside hydrolase 18 protein [Rhodotorula mucilaginosa]|uniref:Glycoside hydrolase 18 protein n=1 Tax=Rhodotorula mucilaginosa TaxID=5537 RepID=A0A9P6W5L5_RHOMI|nr:Glycoside hydrolase 18 protein [Rhodotorula mucilaginosa]
MQLVTPVLAFGALLALQPACAQTSVSNLETFPTILPDPPTASSSAPGSSSSTSTPSGTPFDPVNFPTGPGPAIFSTFTDLPSGVSTSGASASATSSSSNRTTAVSAASRVSTTSPAAATTDTVVTSTVDGSVTTVTVTSSNAGGAAQTSKPSSGAERIASVFGTWKAVGTVTAAAVAFAVIL